jgi:catalase
LTAVEQQFLVNAIRFETSHIQSPVVRQNVLTQLNRVSNELAKRVAAALGMVAPAPDPTFYHNNKTAFITITGNSLPKIATLQIGVLASVLNGSASLAQAAALKSRLARDGLVVTVIGEALAGGVDITYSAADATAFDGIIVVDGAQGLFDSRALSTLYPRGRPTQILLDGYRWGKPVGVLGTQAATAYQSAGIASGPGVYSGTDMEAFVTQFEKGLTTFKFVDRFPLDVLA